MQATVIISRADGETGTHAAFAQALAECCLAGGFDVMSAPSLYHLPEDSSAWEALASLSEPRVLISWLHPRPTEWLLARHGIAPVAAILHAGDFDTVEAALEAIEAATGQERSRSGSGALRELAADTASRWYPVIDGSRCAQCRHCLQFCLFGVYETDACGRLVVAHPDRCKPGCPACSRICPEGAIIFPLYSRDPAIAGVSGRYMVPDLAARKMYYTRTKLPCPHCGRAGEHHAGDPKASGIEFCDECGRPVPATAAAPPAPREPDDIDRLIDDLDRLAKERG